MSRDDGNMSMGMAMPMQMPMSPPGGGGGESDEMGTMHMSFFWGKDVVILFDGWPGAGRVGMYILALAVIFLLAAMAEILSVVPKLRSREINPAVGAVVHAGVYAFRMGLAYLVMLSVMSYNIGVFVAAIAGHTLGNFLVKYRDLSARAKGGDYSP